ncbi:hypothetical protein Tco_0278779, partial [Tanacetum coccineum]
SESGSPLMTEARLLIHGQDPGADDLINSETTTDYDWSPAVINKQKRCH